MGFKSHVGSKKEISLIPEPLYKSSVDQQHILMSKCDSSMIKCQQLAGSQWGNKELLAASERLLGGL